MSAYASLDLCATGVAWLEAEVHLRDMGLDSEESGPGDGLPPYGGSLEGLLSAILSGIAQRYGMGKDEGAERRRKVPSVKMISQRCVIGTHGQERTC